MYNILIVGYGNIGKRYHQAAINTNLDIKFFIIDKKKISNSLISLTKIKVKNIDLAIISTTADARLKEVKKIIKKFKVGAWILEKNLGQTPAQIQSLQTIFKNNKNVWISTNYKTMNCFKKLKKKLENKKRIKVNVSGVNWGLCCNAMHFIDTFGWIFSEKIQLIDTKQLNKFWVNSKRKNFSEIHGTLKIKYITSEVNLISKKPNKRANNPEISYDIFSKNYFSKYLHESGIFIRNNKKYNFGKIEPISLNMIDNIKKILRYKKSELFLLSECIEAHKLFISKLNEHWALFGNQKLSKKLPAS